MNTVRAARSPAPDDGPSEQLEAAYEAFRNAYDADEGCEDGEGVYCAKCVKRALGAALRAARSPAGTGQERDYEMFEDGDMWPSSRPGSEPADASELLAFMPRHHRARTSLENINDTLMALDGWRAGGPPSRPGSAPDADEETLAAAVHEAYLATCARLGWPVKPDNAVPYRDLSEASKELDRASVRAVVAALRARPVEATGGERGEVTGMDGDANEDDWP